MTVKIYTTQDCIFCKEAKQILDEWHIEYEEYDLKDKKNREARAFYRSVGATTAPVIVNGGKWILIDYDRSSLISLLEE